jgi:hypothetical protein
MKFHTLYTMYTIHHTFGHNNLYYAEFLTPPSKYYKLIQLYFTLKFSYYCHLKCIKLIKINKTYNVLLYSIL